MNKNTELVIKDLKKTFGKNKVLNGIDFKLTEGERVVVLGPSGSGKSTFLRCIKWMEEPTTGEIRFDGELVTEHDSDGKSAAGASKAQGDETGGGSETGA